MTPIEKIAAERKRQIEVEGFDTHHDMFYQDELIDAAAYLLAQAAGHDMGHLSFLQPDGWKDKWVESKGRERDLIRAAALIVAELDRYETS